MLTPLVGLDVTVASSQTTVPLDPLDLQDRPESQEMMVNQEPQESLEVMATLEEALEAMADASSARSDHPDHQDPMESLDQQDPMETRERLDPDLDLAQLDHQDHPETLDRMEPLAQPEHLENPEHLEPVEKDFLDLLDRPDLWEDQDSQDPMEILEQVLTRDLQDLQDLLEAQDSQEPMELQDSQDLMENPAAMASTVHAHLAQVLPWMLPHQRTQSHLLLEETEEVMGMEGRRKSYVALSGSAWCAERSPGRPKHSYFFPY